MSKGKFELLEGENKPLRKHTNGSVCREGLTNVPKDFVACCDMMGNSVKSCEADHIRFEYYPKRKEWGMRLLDGSSLTAKFCPWCGVNLPK